MKKMEGHASREFEISRYYTDCEDNWEDREQMKKIILLSNIENEINETNGRQQRYCTQDNSHKIKKLNSHRIAKPEERTE